MSDHQVAPPSVIWVNSWTRAFNESSSYRLISSKCSLILLIGRPVKEKRAGPGQLVGRIAPLGSQGAKYLIYLAKTACGAAFTIDWVVKKSLSTAPMLMYQHSRSGVFCHGK